jgi:hypothetical protein
MFILAGIVAVVARDRENRGNKNPRKLFTFPILSVTTNKTVSQVQCRVNVVKSYTFYEIYGLYHAALSFRVTNPAAALSASQTTATATAL